MDNELLKRYSLAEIAFLAIFVLGIGLAQIIVKVRHQIKLSEPIALLGSGLLVSMPTNPGWEYETVWRYESDNSMALVGKHQSGRFRDASVQWSYYLCRPEGTARELLEQRIDQAGTKLGQIESLSGAIDMDYAIIHSEGTNQPFYLGLARMDLGRCLELRVYPQDADGYYAENLFRSLFSSIQYELPEQLQHGKNLTRDFWKTLVANWLSLSENKEDAFLVKSSQNQIVGYSQYQYAVLNGKGKKQPELSVHQYERNFLRVESTLLFHDSSIFTWTTSIQRIGMNQPRKYTISNGPDGIIQVHSDSDENKQFATDSLFVPELLLPEYAAMLLDYDRESFVVDVLLSNGLMVPAGISRIDVSEGHARSEEIAYVIRINFFNRQESIDELYYDADKQLVGRFEKQPSRQRLWDLTSPDNIEQIFKDILEPPEDNAPPFINKETIKA